MKIYPDRLFADAKEERRQGEQAFTMVEIAIAIGVIGFALVAVIGILPTGMNVQKDNREDATISEDASFFLDAIRNGGSFTNPVINHGLDFLTNYVEKIMIVGVTNGIPTTNAQQIFTEFKGGGAEIIGLLSTPEGLGVTGSNYTITRAIIRALKGSAVQQNGANLATAFRYQLDVQIVPFVNVAPNSINFSPTNGYLPGAPESVILTEDTIRSNRWMEVTPSAPTNGSIYLQEGAGALAYNCFDVRLHFNWPMLPSRNNTLVAGPRSQNYRTTVASALVEGARLADGAQLWFLQPQLYANQLTLPTQ